MTPLVLGTILFAATADPGCGCPTPDALARMTRPELLALYTAADPGAEPAGDTDGRALPHPGTPAGARKSRLIGLLWKGKAFPGDGQMVNRLPLGLRAVRARVLLGESWYDGRPAWVFDYCGTSKLFPHVRDEVRELAPGVYLGLTYMRKPGGPELATFFTLDGR